MTSSTDKARDTKVIYCAGCIKPVKARLTNGSEIYPHRPDLHELPFWKCDTCENYVGCHHKTDKPTKPLGCIPTKEILTVRKQIHAVLDPIWKSGKMKRGQAYAYIGHRFGRQYHTGELRTLDEAKEVFGLVKQLEASLQREDS